MTYVERLILGCIKTMSREELARLEDAIQARRNALDICEHGVPLHEYCEPCNREYKRARAERGDAESDA